MDPQELLDVLTPEYIGFNVSMVGIDRIMGEYKPIAVYDSTNRTIHIVLSVPVAKGIVYNLYESLAVPKVVNASVVIVSNINKYFAVSEDNKKFMELNELVCNIISGIHICKDTLSFSVNRHSSCLTNVYFDNLDDLCIYKQIQSNFFAHSILNSGVLLFTTEKLAISVSCHFPSFEEIVYVNGSSLISPPYGCSLNSTLFSFRGIDNGTIIFLKNKIPRIDCCSEYFRQLKNRTIANKTIILNSFHDIQSFNATELMNQITAWEKLKGFDFKSNFNSWKKEISYVSIIIMIVIITLIFVKCIQLFKSNSTDIRVVFRADEVKPDSTLGYPTF